MRARAPSGRERSPLLQRIEDATRWRHRIIPRARPENLVRARIDAGRVLDIGCGTGSHALPFVGDFVPYGIELSRALAEEANGHFAPHGGHCVHAESRAGLAEFAEDFFSAAVLRSYLEHEAYPNEVLAGLARVLRPGGVAIVKVPNYGSLNRMVMGAQMVRFPGSRPCQLLHQDLPDGNSRTARIPGRTAAVMVAADG